MLIGALEAGGTKMVCAIGTEDVTILEQISIPTTTPEETIPKLIEYFKDKEIAALGVGAFGPVDVNTKSETCGYILDTPKLAWRHKDLIGGLRDALKVPVGLDTDVNGSCLGEVTYGCAKGLDSVIYITIGTGVGVGAWVNGGLLHGMLHMFFWYAILRIRREASARITRTVWRALQAVPPLKKDGAKRQWTWWTIRRPGSWRVTILPSLWWTTSFYFHPRRSYWAEVSCIRCSCSP